jgi:DNA polymerase epsilon subunit 1
MVKSQLEAERFPGKVPDAPMRAFHELTAEEQATFIKKRLKDYANKVQPGGLACLGCGM